MNKCFAAYLVGRNRKRLKVHVAEGECSQVSACSAIRHSWEDISDLAPFVWGSSAENVWTDPVFFHLLGKKPHKIIRHKILKRNLGVEGRCGRTQCKWKHDMMGWRRLRERGCVNSSSESGVFLLIYSARRKDCKNISLYQEDQFLTESVIVLFCH